MEKKVVCKNCGEEVIVYLITRADGAEIAICPKCGQIAYNSNSPK